MRGSVVGLYLGSERFCWLELEDVPMRGSVPVVGLNTTITIFDCIVDGVIVFVRERVNTNRRRAAPVVTNLFDELEHPRLLKFQRRSLTGPRTNIVKILSLFSVIKLKLRKLNCDFFILFFYSFVSKNTVNN